MTFIRIGRLLDGDLDRAERIATVRELVVDAEAREAAAAAVNLEAELKAWDPAERGAPPAPSAPLRHHTQRRARRRPAPSALIRLAATVAVCAGLFYTAGALGPLGKTRSGAEFTPWGEGFSQVVDQNNWEQVVRLEPGEHATLAVSSNLDEPIHFRFVSSGPMECAVTLVTGKGANTPHRLKATQVHYASLHHARANDRVEVANHGRAAVLVAVRTPRPQSARLLRS